MTGDDWTIKIIVPAGTTEVLPILQRHSWSGIAEVHWGDKSVVEDLYSWFPFAQPLRIKNSGPTAVETVTLKSRGQNPLSHSGEAVIFGVLFR